MKITGKARYPYMDKYSTAETPYNIELVGNDLPEHSRAYIRASITASSWRKHSSAMHCFRQYEASEDTTAEWPLHVNVICKFASWCLSRKDLKPSTVRSYLSSLATVHELKGLCTHSCHNPLVKRILRGADNLAFYQSLSKNSRKVMSLPLLKY